MTTVPVTTLPAVGPTQETINRYWDLRAAVYDAAQQRPDRRTADQRVWGSIFDATITEGSCRVLDVGTGSGFLAFILANLGHEVVATDLSEQMLDRARRRAETVENSPSFVLGDAVNPALQPSSFDAITGRYLMWTLREPLLAARNWLKVLRPGGIVAMVDAPWFPEGLDANPTQGFREHYSSQIRADLPLAESSTIHDSVAVLVDAGFEDVCVIPLHSVLELDRNEGTVPGHEVTLQFLITGRRPLIR